MIVLVTCTMLLVTLIITYIGALKFKGLKVTIPTLLVFVIWFIGGIIFFSSKKISSMDENVAKYEAFEDRDS